MITICLDAAHGLHGKNVKRSPNGTEEWFLNASVCDKIERILQNYDVNIIRLDDVTGEVDKQISERVDKAIESKPSAVISIHHNIIGNGNWISSDQTGDFISINTSKSVHSKEQYIAELILSNYSKQSNLKNNHSHTSKMLICNYEDYSVDNCIKLSINGACINDPLSYTYAISEQGKDIYAESVASALIHGLGLIKKNILAKSSEKINYYVRKSFKNNSSEVFRSIDINSAITVCNEYNGYSVYSNKGELIHKSTHGKIPTGAKQPYLLEAIVNTVTGLSLRVSEDPNSDRIVLLEYGSKVKILDRGALGQYWKVKASIDGKTIIGYMYGKYLRLI